MSCGWAEERFSSSARRHFSFLFTAGANMRRRRRFDEASVKRNWEEVMSSAATTGVKTYQNHVNGKWESASSGKTFPVYDPSTEEVIAHVAASDAADVDRA